MNFGSDSGDGAAGGDIASNLELFGFSQESLPHIPLRPFRNQVGGHSAIYKFTKRAVCKVRKNDCLKFTQRLTSVT